MPFWLLPFGSINRDDVVYLDMIIDDRIESVQVKFWFIGFTIGNPGFWFYTEAGAKRVNALEAIINFK